MESFPMLLGVKSGVNVSSGLQGMEVLHLREGRFGGLREEGSRRAVGQAEVGVGGEGVAGLVTLLSSSEPQRLRRPDVSARGWGSHTPTPSSMVRAHGQRSQVLTELNTRTFSSLCSHSGKPSAFQNYRISCGSWTKRKMSSCKT